MSKIEPFIVTFEDKELKDAFTGGFYDGGGEQECYESMIANWEGKPFNFKMTVDGLSVEYDKEETGVSNV